MRFKSALMTLLVMPALLAWGGSRAAAAEKVGGAKILLSDGSYMNGSISFVINLDTQSGQVKIQSSSLASAKFDGEWADIWLSGAELKLKFKAASSTLTATTAAGSLKIDLAKVVSIDMKPAQQASSQASSNAAASQPSSAPPLVSYAQQQPPAATAPPTVVYRYPYQYQYVAPAPYYAPSYYYPPYYWPGPYIGWPFFGIGIHVGPRWGFGLRIR
jgi:hypothetical protein